jgi:hypothetical protein
VRETVAYRLGGADLETFVQDRRGAAARELQLVADAMIAAVNDALRLGLDVPAMFLTPLIAEKVGRKQWRLLAPLVYYSARFKRVVIVPAGTVTDFASVPRTALLYALMGNTAHEESLPHDHAYQTGEIPRGMADEIFAESFNAIRSSGSDPYEPRWRRAVMPLGPKAFGGFFYQGADEIDPEQPLDQSPGA